MKKLFLVAICLLAVPLFATDYTVSTSTARQDQILNQHRVILNTETCASVQLPPSCTQAQARAVTPGVNIYTTVADYIQRHYGPTILATAKAGIAANEARALCLWWNGATTTRPAQDRVCIEAGLAANCEVCP